jgi:hypothetical protein
MAGETVSRGRGGYPSLLLVVSSVLALPVPPSQVRSCRNLPFQVVGTARFHRSHTIGQVSRITAIEWGKRGVLRPVPSWLLVPRIIRSTQCSAHSVASDMLERQAMPGLRVSRPVCFIFTGSTLDCVLAARGRSREGGGRGRAFLREKHIDGKQKT